MGHLFSEDLKWRIVYLHQDGYSKRRISKLLYMSYSENPFKGASGRKKLFKDSDMKNPKKLVKERVDWYLDELVVEMEAITSKRVSIPILWHSLKYCRITRKKIHTMAAERNELLRSAFIAKIGNGYVPEQFVFLDESAKDEDKRYTILPALTIDGIVAVEIIERSYDKKKFEDFIYTQVIPHMNPFPGKNSVLVMDNARIHHNAEWISVIEELGGHILFLSPYSPDFNPIELAFSTIKAWLQRNNDFVHTCSDVVGSSFEFSSGGFGGSHLADLSPLVLLFLLIVMVMLSSSLLALVLH
ncbi:2299_t:CDS:2 [Acaulospora morrowiae]|uniref:2299_t:CDS:1 n=1 Tax=Acaulospora morrowiae TaxID=94023 RepID=A0A9N9CVV7_9GLOM|nr:2299_t:CDS:2 [Acaulospora morrowiae]